MKNDMEQYVDTIPNGITFAQIHNKLNTVLRRYSVVLGTLIKFNSSSTRELNLILISASQVIHTGDKMSKFSSNNNKQFLRNLLIWMVLALVVIIGYLAT